MPNRFDRNMLMEENNNQKQLLQDVVIIRPILVLLLVFYHAFAPYSGAWTPIEGYPDIPMYWWLDKLSYAFMLEMFVFISGYVFGYQVRTNGEIQLAAKTLFWGKFKRLIIPSMVFSLLYLVLFQNITQPITETMYDIVKGVAHMWFLPMLFWCFIGVWLIEQQHINRWIALIAFFLCSLIPLSGLPLQLSKAMYYMFFFYTGFFLQRHNVNLDRLEQPVPALVLAISFLFLFLSLTLLREKVGILIRGENQQTTKVLGGVIIRLCQLIYSFVGVSMLLSLSKNIIRKQKKPLPEWVIKIGALCMGVYLLQQFILKAIYGSSIITSSLGPYRLPWVGFVVTLLSSVLIAMLMRKTKVGKFLIG